jgi:HK97 family phage prohead protease
MEQKFTFFTESIDIKSITDDEGEKQHIVTGYISTDSLDLVGDIVTKSAMEDMVTQIKSGNIKLDIDHEAPKRGMNIVPVGKIIDAKIDGKGLWVKAVINKYSSRFKEVWMSIKSGMIDAFSIAYKPVKAVNKVVDGKSVRQLDLVKLVNVALTGNPINEDCRIGAVMMKSLENLNTEADKMAEEMKEEAPAPAVEEAPAPVAEAEVKSEVVETPTHEAEIKSLSDEMKNLTAEVKSMTESNVKNAEEMIAIKAKLEAAETAMAKPQLKSEVKESVPEAEEAPVATSPLGLIQ